jgi:hypothetical protein
MTRYPSNPQTRNITGKIAAASVQYTGLHALTPAKLTSKEKLNRKKEIKNTIKKGEVGKNKS